MNLNPIANNQNEITLPNGFLVFFSYSTPVAMRTSEGVFYYDETKYSATTSKHISAFKSRHACDPIPCGMQIFRTLLKAELTKV